MELKSLYFNKVYVFLFSAKTRTHKQNTRTYTQSGAENSLFQFCRTITELFSPKCGGGGGGGKTIEMWRWWWWRENNRNVAAVVVVVEGKPICGWKNI